MSRFEFAIAARDVVSADNDHRIAEERAGNAHSAMRKLANAWVSEAIGPPTPADVLGVGWREHSVTDTHLGDLFTNGVRVGEIHFIRDSETHQPIEFRFVPFAGWGHLAFEFIDGVEPASVPAGRIVRGVFGSDV